MRENPITKYADVWNRALEENAEIKFSAGNIMTLFECMVDINYALLKIFGNIVDEGLITVEKAKVIEEAINEYKENLFEMMEIFSKDIKDKQDG